MANPSDLRLFLFDETGLILFNSGILSNDVSHPIVEKAAAIASSFPHSRQIRPSRHSSVLFQFTIGKLLALIACGSTLFVFGESWFTLFVFELAVVYLISEILVTSLPSKLHDELTRNCIRVDGSWSNRRERLESNAVNKLRWDIRVVLALILIPTTLLVWVVDQEVIPLSLGVDALITAGTAKDLNRGAMRKEESQFDSWKQSKSGIIETEAQKRFLWRYWPVGVVAAVLWVGFCWTLLKSSYVQQLKTLDRGLHERRWEYTLQDRARSREWCDRHPD